MQLGPAYDQAVRLRNLEERLARLEGNELGQAFSTTQSDGSVGMQLGQYAGNNGANAMLFYQSTDTPRDSQTGQHPTFLYVGEVYSSSGPNHAGAVFFRPDLSESAVVGSSGLQILDKVGNRVVGSDEYGTSPSGKGLNSPWVSCGAPIANDVAKWPQTTSASLVNVSILSFPTQHANITWTGQAYCPTGTTGQVQVQLNSGAAGPVHTVGSGFTTITETIPLGTWSFQQVLALTGNAAVTAGAGPIYFGIYGVWGQGSS